MGSTLHSETVHLISKLADVSLGLSACTLQSRDTKIQGIQALRSLLGHIGVVSLETVHAIVRLLVEIFILLLQHGLHLDEPRVKFSIHLISPCMYLLVDFSVSAHLAFQVPAMRDPLLNSLGHNRVIVINVTLDVGCVGVDLFTQEPVLLPQGTQFLVHLAPAAVHLQTQSRCHVTDRLDRSIDVIIHVIPRRDVRLPFKLDLGLLTALGHVF
mmetsp:Transcript_49332/g.88665  ORF Transcript_49332/g.88665 Transcript_49332/m.88665 type:complete len:213 (+) Transcript_49332:460-1098(+)